MKYLLSFCLLSGYSILAYSESSLHELPDRDSRLLVEGGDLKQTVDFTESHIGQSRNGIKRELHGFSGAHRLFYVWEEHFNNLTTGSVEDFQKMLAGVYDIDINTKDREGRTALLYLLQWKSPFPWEISSEIVRVFIRYGSDPHAKDKRGNGVLHYAAKNAPHVLEFFLGLKADPLNKNFYSQTALAVVPKSSKAAQILTKAAQLKQNERRSFGQRALDTCRRVIVGIMW